MFQLPGSVLPVTMKIVGIFTFKTPRSCVTQDAKYTLQIKLATIFNIASKFTKNGII